MEKRINKLKEGTIKLIHNTHCQCNPESSFLALILLVAKWLELLLSADAGQSEVAILILSDISGADELLEQIKGGLAFALAVLHHLHFGLQDVVLLDLGLGCPLLSLLSLQLVGDLLLGPSALVPHLEQFGRDALGRCNNKTVNLKLSKDKDWNLRQRN